jgi:hypothetical protein
MPRSWIAALFLSTSWLPTVWSAPCVATKPEPVAVELEDFEEAVEELEEAFDEELDAVLEAALDAELLVVVPAYEHQADTG